MTRLVIEPVGLRWLYNEEPTDLCAHGGFRVLLDGEVVFEQGTEDDGLTLSTGALHLLRTIERDYEPGSEVSGQLVPCCGHWMVFDQDLNEVVNSPCPNGIDWTVLHVGNSVKIRMSDKAPLVVDKEEWKRAVHDFSAQVRAFYFADPPRVADDAMDTEWHPHFLDEWNRRHEAAA
jgi:hypothetical protein